MHVRHVSILNVTSCKSPNLILCSSYQFCFSFQCKHITATQTLMVLPFKILTLFKMQIRNFLLGYHIIFFNAKKLRCGRRKSQKEAELGNQTKATMHHIHISRNHNIPKPSRSPNNSNFLVPCRY